MRLSTLKKILEKNGADLSTLNDEQRYEIERFIAHNDKAKVCYDDAVRLDKALQNFTVPTLNKDLGQRITQHIMEDSRRQKSLSLLSFGRIFAPGFASGLAVAVILGFIVWTQGSFIPMQTPVAERKSQVSREQTKVALEQKSVKRERNTQENIASSNNESRNIVNTSPVPSTTLSEYEEEIFALFEEDAEEEALLALL